MTKTDSVGEAVSESERETRPMRAQAELVVTQRDRQDVNLSLFLFLSWTLVSGAFTS